MDGLDEKSELHAGLLVGSASPQEPENKNPRRRCRQGLGIEQSKR